jgi:hypothetical protein
MQRRAQRMSVNNKTGKWLTEVQFSALTGITRSALAGWRHFDLKAGRTQAQDGKPHYQRFGRAIRYWAGPELFNPSNPNNGEAA